MKRKLFAAVLAFCMVLSLVNVQVFADGTPDALSAAESAALMEATAISTPAELAAISSNLSGSYTLTNDIDLSAFGEWTPIGTGTEDGERFSGYFDGQGHTIRGVTMSGSGYSYSGLFGVVSGRIENLNVEITIIDANSAGGLVGYLLRGRVECCSAGGSISGQYDIGGLVGCCESGTIRNCYSTTAVTSSSTEEADGCGGLVGELYGCNGTASITSCYAVGKVVKTGTTGLGGLVGFSTRWYGSLHIVSSYYNISTTKMGDEQRGFGVTTPTMKKQNTFVGWDFDNIWGIDPTVNNGYPYLKLTGEYQSFLLDGAGTKGDPYIVTTEAELAAMARGELINSFTAYFQLENDIALTSDYWTPIGGNGMPQFSGVFDGNGHTISGLNIAFPGYSCLGLFGEVGGTVQNLHVVGKLSDAYTAGVLAGYLVDGRVECCSAGGSISGQDDIGGLIGRCENGTIRNCYSTTAVTSSSTDEEDGCGGLVGELYGNDRTASITSCYAVGKVVKTGTTGLGGIVGFSTRWYGSVPIVSSYYNISTTKMGDEKRGFGVTTSTMKKQSTFLGWDFDNIWGIDASINSGYPYLKLTGEYQSFELEGSGTSRDPYIIYTEAELAAVARGEITKSFTAYYQLGSDIVLTSDYWTPIGGNDMPAFSGTFDGDGHTITGLSIAFPAYEFEGLFGEVTGTVKNLNVMGLISDAYTAGTLAAYLKSGTVAFCSGGGSISGQYDIGGLVGYCERGTIRNCYSTTAVTSSSTEEADGCGGLVGELYGYNGTASITSCYAVGKVVKTGASGLGGIVGYSSRWYGNAPIICSYYDAETTTIDAELRGFGLPSTLMKTQSTYANWDFENIWGIDAFENNGYPYLKLTGGYQSFELEGSGTSRDPYIIYTEAELAAVARGEITNNFTAHYQLGDDIVLTSSYWTPIGGNQMPAFSGSFDGDGHTISGLGIAFPAYEDEGLFGFVSGTIKNLHVEGTIKNAVTAGMLAGVLNGGTVECCSSAGSISGRRDTGGLIGGASNGTISNCYSTVAVTNSSSGEEDGCGGLVGELNGGYDPVSIKNSYAIGKVVKSDTSGLGGLVGFREPGWNGIASVISCFCNNYNDNNPDKGTYKSTEEMKDRATYGDWDFDTVWGIDASRNNGFPYLQVMGEVVNVPVEDVSLNETALPLTVGESETLTVTVSPANATNKAVTWTSSAPGVASVSNGVVTAKAPGTAVITVTCVANSAISASCTVTVTASTVSVTGVSLNKTTLALTVGDTAALTATVAPENATNKAVTWTSSAPDIAAVSNGLVTAKATGTATVTVRTEDGGFTANCAVTVTEPVPVVSVTGVSLNKTALSLTVGGTAALTATVVPGNATNRAVSWSSDKPGVAKVSADGTVTAVAAGTATVTVRTEDGGFTASCTVTVIEPVPDTVPVTGVAIFPSSLTLTEGETATLTATVSPANASNQNVSWRSSDESVATVSRGAVTAQGPGTAAVTAITEDGGKTATVSVTVRERPSVLERLELSGDENLETIEGLPLDLSGLVVTAVYSGGVRAVVTDYTVSELNTNELGAQTLTVSYGGMEASVIVTVIAKSATGITIATEPVKLSYIVGDPLNTDGLTITVFYNNGTETTLTRGFTVDGYDASAIGSQSVIVNYQGFTASFTVTVSEAPVSGDIAKPMFRIESVENGKRITLTSATEGAEIYYTTDGTTPTASSTRYIEPFTVRRAQNTVKAVAILGGETSKVSTGVISVSQVGAPDPNPGGGTVPAGTVLTLRTDTIGAEIYYTDGDGAFSKDSWIKYNGAVVIDRTKTIRAIAVKDGYVNSAITRLEYTVPVVELPRDNVVVTLGSVTVAAGDVASIPIYLFTDSEDTVVYSFRLSFAFDKDVFENYVSLTPGDGIPDASQLYVSNTGGVVNVLYQGEAISGGSEIGTLNFGTLASMTAGTELDIEVNLGASSVTTNAGGGTSLTSVNAVVTLTEARVSQLAATVTYTTTDGQTAESISDLGDTDQVEVNATFDDSATAGLAETTANVYLVIYDRDGRMVSVDTWKVDLSDPAFLFIRTISIPEDVEVGAIKIMVLSDAAVPLVAAGELAK